MESAPRSRPVVAVTIPAYNEADGIGEFIREIDGTLRGHTGGLNLIVIDDASNDGTGRVLEALAPTLAGNLEVMRNPVNLGHGPSLLAGYRRALELEPDFVLAVDGDGQFRGTDLRRVLVLLRDEAHAVCGVRRFRHDPWFRMVMTRLLRAYVRLSFGVRARDPNCPLRGYEGPALRALLDEVPDPCLIPNLYLTIVASRRGAALLEVDVSHQLRRGRVTQGSSWGRGRSPVPWRLVRFSLVALRESWSFRRRIDSLGAPAVERAR